MKRTLVLAAIFALALPAVALAKGPSSASISGPSSARLKMGGSGETTGTPLGDLTDQAGFFPAVYGQDPDPMLPTRPKGDLGPKYTISYDVPDGTGKVFRIEQDVYPYAKPPATYMKPGQKVFDMKTRGGWFQADPRLKNTLVSAGLPAIAPTGSTSSSSFPTGLVGGLFAALLLAAATAVVLRRRTRPAAAA